MLIPLSPRWGKFGEKKSNQFRFINGTLKNENRPHIKSLALFSQFPQFLPELWGLMGMAIATFTTNNNEEPTTASRLGGFVSIQFSKPE